MTLWLVLTAMIAVASVLVSTPFIRRFERSRIQAGGNVAVYRDQLHEIENEAAQGVIDRTQAEAASLEIKRRILVADKAMDSAGPSLGQAERKFALTAVTAIVVFGSIVLYAMVGSPEVPSASPAQAGLNRSDSSQLADNRAPPPATSADDTATRPTSQQAPQTGLPSVDEMIQRVQSRLQRNQGDTEGWRMLGWSYFSVERFADAASAYSKAIELRPDSAEYRSARGEALVREADGSVTVAAKKDFDEAVKLDPKDARARFFIGLSKEQGGDKAGALADWNNLLSDADAAEPWLPDLRQRVTDLRRELGDTSPMPSTSSPEKLSADALRDFLASEKAKQQMAETTRRGPGPEDIRNAQNMAPQDRAAMIRSMVDGLAARLEQQPRDAEGWIKLVRSRLVLGDTELANKALKQALTVFAEEGPERTQIAEAAKQLGLTP